MTKPLLDRGKSIHSRRSRSPWHGVYGMSIVFDEHAAWYRCCKSRYRTLLFAGGIRRQRVVR
jgi:hypothetical protein